MKRNLFMGEIVALTLDKVSKKKSDKEKTSVAATAIKQEATVTPWQDFARPKDLLDLIIEKKLSKKESKKEEKQDNE